MNFIKTFLLIIITFGIPLNASSVSFGYLEHGSVIGASTGTDDELYKDTICVFAPSNKMGNCWDKMGIDFGKQNPVDVLPYSVVPPVFEESVIVNNNINGFVFHNTATNKKFFCTILLPQANGYCWSIEEVNNALNSKLPYIMNGVDRYEVDGIGKRPDSKLGI